MTVLNTNTAPDEYELVPEGQKSLALEAQKLALRRIILESEAVHDKLIDVFGDYGYLRAEGLLRSDKTVFTQEEEQLLTKMRTFISDVDLQTPPAKMNHGELVFTEGKTEAKGKLEFATEKFVGQSQNAIRKLIVDNVADLRSIGITFQLYSGKRVVTTDTLANGLTKAIYDRLADWKDRRTTLRQRLAGHDVNEFNVQTATLFADRLTQEELETALHPESAEDKDLQKLRGKAALHSAIASFAAMRVSGEKSYSEISEQLKKIQSDEAALTAPDEAEGQSEAIAGEAIPALTGADDGESKYIRKELRQRVRNLKTHLEKLKKEYDDVKKKFVYIAKAAKQAGKNAEALSTYIDDAGTEPKVKEDETLLTKDFSPDQIALVLKQQFDLTEAGYDDELRKAQKESEEEHEPLTGSAAVLAIYKAYMKKMRPGISDHEAEQAANLLLCESNIDRGLVVDVRKAIDSVLHTEMGKRPMKVLGWVGRQFKELVKGSQHQFVHNLAEAIGLGAGADYESAWRWDSLPFLGKAVKAFTSPDWQKASPRQLITAYYALRESVREGHLSQSAAVSSYVRDQLQIVGNLVATRSLNQQWMDALNIKPVTAENGAHGAHDEKHATESTLKPVARKMQDKRADAVALLVKPIAELPQEYQDGVKRVMEQATENTAYKRKLVSSIAKTAVVTPAKKAWEYGVVTPYELGKSIVMTPINVGMGAVSGISSGVRSGIGGLFQYLFVDKKKFYGSAQASSH